MGLEDVFYKELLNAVLEYQTAKPTFLGRPEHMIDKFWKRVKGFAERGVKPAKILVKDGEARYKNFFKWAARDHHAVELLKTRSKIGDIKAAKALFKHGQKHKKV